MKVFTIQMSKKDFEETMKNNLTPRGISVVVDAQNPEFDEYARLVESSSRGGELGWMQYLVGRDQQEYKVRIVSVKMDGKNVKIETRKPGYV